jgi:hypothetical protein
LTLFLRFPAWVSGRRVHGVGVKAGPKGTVAARLMAEGRQTAAFTMRTRPARLALGQANTIRRAAAGVGPAATTTGIDQLVRQLAGRAQR